MNLKNKKYELILPSSGYEMIKEEMSYEEGEGVIGISAYFSMHTHIISIAAGYAGGFIAGFLSGLLGKTLPTWVGKVIGGVIGCTLGAVIGDKLAKGDMRITIPIFLAWVPFVPSYYYEVDITDAVSTIFGAIGGGFGGAAGGGFGGVAAGFLVGLRKGVVGA